MRIVKSELGGLALCVLVLFVFQPKGRMILRPGAGIAGRGRKFIV
jgi:hypothetical protein